MTTNPLRAYAELWARAFDFRGRSRRAAFWGAIVIDLLFAALLSLLPLAQGIYGALVIVPTVSIAIRRLHDTGRSAWWLLPGLLPVVGGVLLLVLFLMDSDGANRYGASPKYGNIPF